MIRVADVAAHRQSQQLTHEVIFQAGANDLPFIIEIFRADEADHAVHEERIKHSRDTVRARFKRQLIHSVMSFGRKSASLTRFEIHRLCRPSRARRADDGVRELARDPRAASRA